MCHTQGTYLIVMSTSTLCFTKSDIFFRMSSERGATSLQNSCIDELRSTLHKLLYSSLTQQPKCLLVRQRGIRGIPGPPPPCYAPASPLSESNKAVRCLSWFVERSKFLFQFVKEQHLSSTLVSGTAFSLLY